MSDDEPRKTSRREHILSFMKRGGWREDDAKRLFDALDKGEPPPPPDKRDSERKK